MSVYQFCKECPHIETKMVNSVHDPKGLKFGTQVEEISCPARFNPYEGEWAEKKKTNHHICPNHKRYMEMKRKELEAYIMHHRWSH